MLAGLRRESRQAHRHGLRLLCLGDNQSSLLSFEKGRSAHEGLRRLCARAGSLQIGCEVGWSQRYVETTRNPTDAPSRLANSGYIPAGGVVVGRRADLLVEPASRQTGGPGGCANSWAGQKKTPLGGSAAGEGPLRVAPMARRGAAGAVDPRRPCLAHDAPRDVARGTVLKLHSGRQPRLEHELKECSLVRSIRLGDQSQQRIASRLGRCAPMVSLRTCGRGRAVTGSGRRSPSAQESPAPIGTPGRPSIYTRARDHEALSQNAGAIPLRDPPDRRRVVRSRSAGRIDSS